MENGFYFWFLKNIYMQSGDDGIYHNNLITVKKKEYGIIVGSTQNHNPVLHMFQLGLVSTFN